MLISNQGPNTTTIGINFVDGTITADVDQKKACLPEGTKSQFGQYVKADQTEFVLEPGATITTNATITFPAGYAGMNYGCLTYQILDTEAATDEMFNVVTRRASFIDVLVDGNIELGIEVVPQQDDALVSNISDSKNIAVFYDDTTQQHVAKVVIKNIGNIPQEVSVSPAFKDLFTAQELENLTKKILPQQSASFVFPIEDILPFYDGPMSIEMVIEHTPVFEFTSDRITDAMRRSQTIILSASFFLIPWKVILGLLVLLALIAMMTRGGNTEKKTSKPTNKTSPSVTHKKVATSEKIQRKAPAAKPNTSKKTTTTKAASTSTASKKPSPKKA
ncbi:MAG: hypothetical protein H6765_08275 [Candidatus Peribacteria bacterium]|nr:MAG: hypothetical protein H6765_08275 [Candidatus Peribacteria bacterium]